MSFCEALAGGSDPRGFVAFSAIRLWSQIRGIGFDQQPIEVAAIADAAARAHRVIGISTAVTRYFTQRWPERLSRRIETVHYGLDPAPYQAVTDDQIAALRTEWGVAADDLLVGTVARLNVQKALDVMLRGFAMAVAANPEARLKLVLVGQGELFLVARTC